MKIKFFIILHDYILIVVVVVVVDDDNDKEKDFFITIKLKITMFCNFKFMK